MIHFKGTADRDGRIPIFDESGEQGASTSALRLHLRVEPGDAHFEVMLYADTAGNFQPPKLEEIRRLDEFERHAKCLEPHQWSRARQLCICK